MPKAGGQLPGPVTVESCHKSHALPVLTITVRIHRHIYYFFFTASKSGSTKYHNYKISHHKLYNLQRCPI